MCQKGNKMNMDELLSYALRHDFSCYIKDLAESGSLMRVLPEIAVLDEFVHNPAFHPEGCTDESYGTVLDHVLECMSIADELTLTPEEKICVLYHDIGKSMSATGYTSERAYHNFYGHENIGIVALNCLSKKMNIGEDLMDLMKFTTRFHMQFHNINKMRPFKVKRLVDSKYWNELKNVALCDDMSRKEMFSMEDFVSKVNYAESL